MPSDDKAALPDSGLELKKRARRRLVGATALALLAAIVLPMVMDHEPRQPVQDVQVKIPSQDTGGFAARILPAKPAPTPLPPVEAEARPEPKAEVRTETKPEPKPEARPTETPKAEARPMAAKVPDKAADKPAEPPAPRKADEARAAAVLAGGASGDQWVVQLGAYKEAGNVKGLVAKLKQMGVVAYTEDFESPQGPRTRVRAGPFASKEAAEKAQAKIRRIGVDGPVAPK